MQFSQSTMRLSVGVQRPAVRGGQTPLPRCAPRCIRTHVAAAAEAQALPSLANSNGAAPAAAAAAAPPAPASTTVVNPEAFRDLAPPPKAYEIVVNAGAARVGMPPAKCLAMGVLAGLHIGMGGLLLLSVGAACPGLAASNPGLHKLVIGSFGLPVGLILVMTCGAELFTGNVLMMTAAVLEGRAKASDLLQNWGLSFIGNFAGALLLAGLVAATGLFAAAPGPAAVAVAKTSLTWGQAFSRAIIANWMVCVAVTMASAANSFPGKFLAAWVAVSTFTAIGAEHSVANMFIIPAGIFASGAKVSFAHFLTSNLVPVTLGNIAGGVLLAVAHRFVHGKPKPAAAAAAAAPAAA